MSTGYHSLAPAIGGNGENSGEFSRAKSYTQSLYATRRPWRVLFSNFTVPHTFAELASRLNRNLNYFRVNYAMIMLIILFVSLVYHPISMIVFVAVFVLWYFLYFTRDHPIEVFNRTVDDRAVLVGLGVLTVVSLVLTRVWLNVVVAVAVGAAVVGLHAAVRVTEDLFLDEDEVGGGGGGGGLVSVVGARF